MLTDFTRSAPDLSAPDVNAAWEAGVAARRFWEAHQDEYLQRYPEQFVAVKDGEIIATNSDLYELVAVLTRRGIAPQDAWMRFIMTDPQRIVL